ncbi:MAG: hypothetical protein LRY71_01230 [Bacillaceae bacterium]|nr:hypothetical protein [Bacillaceae bacterium]
MDALITHNGASIYEPMTEDYANSASFKMEEVHHLIHFLREEGISFHINSPTYLYAEEDFFA